MLFWYRYVVRSLHDAVAIAHVDERARIGELRLHEEHLRLLRVVKVGLAGDAFDLLDLTSLGRRLDVLEVRLGILARRHEGAEVEEESLAAVVLLKQADDGVGGELLGVLLADVDDDLKVLARVGDEQLAHALQRPLAGQGAEPLDERLGFDGMGVDAAALEVRELGVVLQRAHVQPSLLAQLRHAGAVVVRELPLAEDGVGDVGEGDEIDLEHLGLQPRLLRVIVLEHVQEEGRRLSDHVALEEEIGDGVEIQRRGILLPDLDGDVHRALRVVHQRRLQQVAVVGLVPGHLAVLAHLLKLALARERRHNLGVGARLDVHAKRHVRIDVLEHIAERLRALELILRHPRVQQLLLVLLKHETRELHRLGRVELAPLEADAEVLQQRGVLPGAARGRRGT